ncbi:MAG: flagellar biosynthetic protein FliO [Rhodospirillaceae bacterium]
MGTMSYVQAVLALILVLGLIMGMAWLLRRYGLGEGGRSPLGRKKRVTTVESTSVDARHKLVLVRRDNMEHLLMIGPGDSLVVEQGIPVPTETNSNITTVANS